MATNNKTYRANGTGPARSGRPSASAKSSRNAGGAKATRANAPKGARSQKNARAANVRENTRRTRAAGADGRKASNASQRSAARMNAHSGTKAKRTRREPNINVNAAGTAVATVLGNGMRAVLSNRIATIVVAVVVVLLVVGAVDTFANWNKAYGNVTVAGVDVGGKTPEEIDAVLREALSTNVSQAQVKVYASDDAQRMGSGGMTEEERLAQIERIAQAEQISVEQATANVQSWSTDAQALKASVPYDDLVRKAMAIGRDDGGLFTRLSLMFVKHDVRADLDYDSAAVEALAAEVDRTVGDARIDATVAIEDGVAHAVEGHDGKMVDRTWFQQKLSDALVSGQDAPSFVAVVSDAPSRITFDEAQTASDAVNRALKTGAVFSYKGGNWQADSGAIGSWTRVETVEDGDGYKLQARIDETAAIPAVVQGAGAAVRSENVTVKFAKADDGSIVVRTFGPGNIPEVTPAIQELNEKLYGADGIAWGGSASNGPVSIEIVESDAPAALTLDQAKEAGIVTVIGEYTTEFSNDEGTENRNHNIKLVADILDNGIVDAEGGQWRFNERSGDTNEEAGFWAAGSIIDGEYVDSIGGGICQVATTVFNAAYEAGLPIDMRFPHQLYIASYPPGRDAAVSYPDLDLWWSNNLQSDVLLDLSYTDSSVTARLYSVYTGYTVESQVGNWEEATKYSIKFEEDPDLAKGDSYVKTTGEDGSRIVVTRFVHNEAGETISDQVFESVYDAKDEVVVIGPGTDTSNIKRENDSSTVTWRSSEYW